MKKWMVCLFLAAIMVVSLLPVTVLATDFSDYTELTADGGTLSDPKYYLNRNVKLTNNLTIDGTVTIDLNGFVLEGNGEGSVITVSDGAQLTLEDHSTEKTGKITGGNATNGGAVYNKGTFLMDGVTISGNKATQYGGGVYNTGTFTMSEDAAVSGNTALYGGGVYNTGTFTVKGDAAVSGNTATNGGGGIYTTGTVTVENGAVDNNEAKITSDKGNGGGIYIAGGTVTLKQGSISGNKTGYGGGGVYLKSKTNIFNMEGGIIEKNTAGASANGGGICTNGIVNMTGGEIKSNTAGAYGGGVRIVSTGKFTMTGGSITGNKAASGAGVNTGGTFTVGGTAKITDNTNQSSKADNVNLAKGKTITVGTGDNAPKSGMSVGISTAAVPAVSNPVAVTGTNNADYSGYFISDNPAYKIVDDTNAVKLGIPIAVNIRTKVEYATVQAAVNAAADGDTVQMLADSAENVTIARKVTLDLNGKQLKASSGNVITVNAGASLTLTDGSTDKTGEINGNAKARGIYSAGTLNMNSVTVTNCYADKGGGVYVTGSGSEFNMTGGAVAGNSAYNRGAGLMICDSAKVTVENAKITNNTLKGNTNNGSGIYVTGVYDGDGNGSNSEANGPTVTLTNVEISGNTNSHYGGGIFIKSGTVNAVDCSITKNTAINGGSGVELESQFSHFNMTRGSITKNTLTNVEGNMHKGGGVHFYMGSFTVSGTVNITDNTCNGVTSNVYLRDNPNNIRFDISDMSTESKIGVYAQAAELSSAATVKVTVNGTEAQEASFMSDNGNYAVKFDKDHLSLRRFFNITNQAPEADKDTNHGYIDVIEKALSNETVTVTLTPGSDDYQLAADSLKAYKTDDTNTTVSLTQDATDKTKYTFIMPEYDITVTAIFEETPWVKLQNALNGTCTASVANLFEINGNTVKLLADFTAEAGNTTLAVSGTKVLDLNGHTINANQVKTVGSVITVPAEATLTLEDHSTAQSGKITGGIGTGGSTKNGGGVNVEGTFNMNGGSIVENKATYGAGVYVRGTFTMSGNSRIVNNTGSNTGGGVYNSGTFMMEGGVITNNKADANGGGVYNNDTLFLGGSAKITDNVWKKNKTTEITQNLHMPSKKTITLGTGSNGIPAPTTDMSVGISLFSSHDGVFTGENSTDYSNLFTADLWPEYKVINLTDNRLKLVKKYEVTVDPGITNGTVTTDATDSKAFEADNVTVSVYPDDGYELESLVYADSTDHDITDAKSFAMPGANVTVTAKFKQLAVASPVASPEAGIYSTAQTVTLSTTTGGAEIYYTTDGTTPTTGSTKYTGAITVDVSRTIKAIAVRENWADSEVMTADYTITGTVAAPVASPAAGTYTTAQTVILSTITDGAEIYYTTDGTTPTTGSTKYTGAITVDVSRTIKAIAVRENWTDSKVTEAAYTINYPVTKVEVSPETMNMRPGEGGKITVTITPENATDKTLTVSMDQDGIVTVAEDGTVTALKDGTVKVTFTAAGGASDTCVITVKSDPIQYRIIRGANQTVLTNAEQVVFASDADFSKFLYVEVDGNKLSKDDYDSRSGSTVIVLKRAFIKKLGLGVHTLKIVSNDGSASTRFTIRKLPNTGDNTPVALLTLALLAALGTIAFVMKKQRKHN